MKQNTKLFSIICTLFFVSCSSDFLDYNPTGVINGNQLNTPENADKLVTAAYASLGNDDWAYPFTSFWLLGSVRSDDAFKGGGSVPDQGQYNQMEQFSLMTVDQSRFNMLWIALYEGVGRANEALRRLDALTESEYPDKKLRQGESRFIRGHFYFLLKILFKYPVWFDEFEPKDELKDITNRDYTNDEIWDLIASDFQFSVENLPMTQDEVGRANKVSAWAYLAKVRLYQAYEQNEQNEVTSVNQSRLEQVVEFTTNVINSGQHSLSRDFAENFLTEFENGTESIFAIQYSVDDGTPNGRVSKGTSLNYNMASVYGCCDFHNPSQNLVNPFKTNDDGIPMIDTFNAVVIKDSIDFWNNNIDPRLDHTIGIVGHPFKYQPNFIMQSNWRRAPQVYGYYSTMKEIVSNEDPTFRKIGAFHASALNVDILRYDDVILMKAEALIELGRHQEALPLINEIRQRAAQSLSLIH